MRCGVVFGVMLAGVPVTARAVVLERVRVQSGRHLRVEFATSAPVVPWVRRLAATADTPHRIYVDLPDTVLSRGIRKVMPSPAPGLVRVRTGQFTPTTARVVLDTATELPFTVEGTDRGVVIVLRPPDTAAAVPRPIPPPPPESGLPLIVIDAGHGGHDPGAEGIDGVQEKTVVLQIAHRLAAKLPARLAVDSLLTRSDDSFVPLGGRFPHRDRRNAVFVSLHANACDQPEPRGVEIFFADPAELHGPRHAKQLARFITTELRARLIRVRGRPRHGPFTVLTGNHVPSVLIELGYLTHREDAARLQDPKYQELLTDAVVDAIATYLQRSPSGTVQVGQSPSTFGRRLSRDLQTSYVGYLLAPTSDLLVRLT
jgi:N-acetylmuramoyl-L-alanine amidase